MGEFRKDCFAAIKKISGVGVVTIQCNALNEVLCITKDRCPFYMSKQDKIIKDNILLANKIEGA